MDAASARDSAIDRLGEILFERAVAEYLERMAPLEPATSPADNVTHDKHDHRPARRHLQPV